MIDHVEVVPGPGTVVRYGGIVAWAAPTASPALISFLAQSARNLAPVSEGGQQLVDHLARLLQERDPEPEVAFAVVGPGPGGWVALLHGPVQAWDGVQWLAPTPESGWLSNTLGPQPAVTITAAGSAPPTLAPDSMWDLGAGVVPGRGFVLVPANADHAPTPDEPESVPAGEPTTIIQPPEPTSVLPTVDAGPAGLVLPTVYTGPALPVLPAVVAGPDQPASSPSGPSSSIDLRKPVANRPAPLPIGRGPDARIPGAPVVAGVLCERGHLNRPGVGACVRCSTPLDPAVQYTVSGTRPSLGIFVTDDGRVYALDAGYVAGSEPAGDGTVRGGLARPLPLSGDGMSPAHAEIRLDDWDVVVTDRGTSTGTSVFEPGATDWERLAPYQPKRLRPGTHIAFGPRVVTFVTPWVVKPVQEAQDTSS